MNEHLTDRSAGADESRFWRLLGAYEALVGEAAAALTGEDFARLQELTHRRVEIFVACRELGEGRLGWRRGTHPALDARLEALAATERAHLEAVRETLARVNGRIDQTRGERRRRRRVDDRYVADADAGRDGELPEGSSHLEDHG